MPEAAEPIVREARFDDFEAVRSLRLRFGLGDDSPQDWRALWLDNPALTYATHLPIGWVSLGRAPNCRFRGIDPDAGCIRRAIPAGRFRARDGDRARVPPRLLLEAQCPAFSARGGRFGPQHLGQLRFRANRPSVWRLCRCHHPATTAHYSGCCDRARFFAPTCDDASPPVFSLPRLEGAAQVCSLADRLARRRRPNRPSGATELSICEIDQIGEEFDGLWARKTRERARLLGVRTAEALRWHFRQSPGARWAKAAAAAARAVWPATRSSCGWIRRSLGLARIRIADLLAENDDGTVIDDLLWASYQQARREGVSVLELVGYPGGIRGPFARRKPYSRQLESWPYFYRAFATELQAGLRSEQAWYACPYDGDDTILAALGSRAPVP